MELLDQYRILHGQGKFPGLSVTKFAEEIGQLCKSYGCETMLDYGAGQGYQYAPPHNMDMKWGVRVHCYDPAVEGMNVLPSGKFDIVLCSDVLEHVPLLEIPGVLENIFSRASKVVFLTTCPRAAKKTLPNGRNCHVTQMPASWWQAEFAPFAEKYSVPFFHRETP